MIRHMVAVIAVGMLAGMSDAAPLLDHFSNDLDLVAADDFDGYGVGSAGVVDGPALGGAGAALGAGFTGTWAGDADFYTDDVTPAGLAGSGNPPPSSDPYAINRSAGGKEQIARPLANPIAKPTTAPVEFIFSFYGTSTHAYGRYGWAAALLGPGNEMLAGAGHDGNGSPAGRIRPWDSSGPDAVNDPAILAPEKRWHHVMLRGLWQTDGAVTLYLYVDPDGATDVADYGASITGQMDYDIAQIQLRTGDFNNANGLNALDEIELRSAVVPEPMSLVILGIGGMTACGRRRRRGR